jgi:eukaryotic-like serine/threonine-protein kinase
MQEEAKEENIPSSIGPYEILRCIGSGGMGEVFLAYDPICKRKIALKRIRTDSDKPEKLREQFLQEATLTAQLIHPCIIPIYSIVDEKDLLYFTMPFIEGQTLKDLLATARESERRDESPNPLSSVTSLSYMFLQICRAIGYAHSQGVIHRDLKPSNIMIGSSGEVRILDWGLVQPISDRGKLSIEEADKVAGSLMYMAPEIILGGAPTHQSEVYSLGLILYQMLTLRYPFHRSEISKYCESLNQETLVDPITVAPSRSIPPILSHITLKCLQSSPKERYQSVQELIYDLESYLEKRSKWINIAKIDPQDMNLWDHLHDVKLPEGQKVKGFLSKQSFGKNIRVEAEVWIGPKGHGIGFLPGMPDGHCVWLGSEINSPSTMIFRNQEKLLEASSISLNKNQWHKMRIDKIESNLYIYIDDIFQFAYVSYLPQNGSYIGLCGIDADYKLDPISISVDATSLHEKPLQGDLFFANKEYSKALEAYNILENNYNDAQARHDAIFHKGLVWLEEAKESKGKKKKTVLIERALSEFTKLHGTSAGPLELLGKLLVSRLQNNLEAELHLFADAFNRFPHHYLLFRIKDHLMSRLFESVYAPKNEFYNVALLAIRYLPEFLIRYPLDILKQQLKSPYFIDEVEAAKLPESMQSLLIGFRIAYQMANHMAIHDMLQDALKLPATPMYIIDAGIFALIELDKDEVALQVIETLHQGLLDVQAIAHLEWIKWIILQRQTEFASFNASLLSNLPNKLEAYHTTLILCLLRAASKQKKTKVIRSILKELTQRDLTEDQKLPFSVYKI